MQDLERMRQNWVHSFLPENVYNKILYSETHSTRSYVIGWLRSRAHYWKVTCIQLVAHRCVRVFW